MYCVLQEGCWGCFDDFQLLCVEGLATFLDSIQAVFGALRSHTDYCFIGDGQEVRQ